ncbi:MAG TPA: 2-phospho-L-lactate guanylyltransferase [Candidatus Binataceae bacterium]|nr:2-phospho-L-lactate guanylyltransferase [Candidatus Binataceae bacterium]
MRAVLIAAKQLALAKTRLAPVLPSVSGRSNLAEAMFRDVLSAALDARTPQRVFVVTCDPVLTAVGRNAGALVIDEEYPRGLNAAVRLATMKLIAAGVTCVCTVLSDIPLVTGNDIDAAFAAMPDGERAVSLVPSQDLSGTNIIVRRPPDIIATQFGRFSLVRHVEDCRQRGIACEILRLEGPALDLDVPADLQEFEQRHSLTHTHAHLARLSLVQN